MRLNKGFLDFFFFFNGKTEIRILFNSNGKIINVDLLIDFLIY